MIDEGFPGRQSYGSRLLLHYNPALMADSLARLAMRRLDVDGELSAKKEKAERWTRSRRHIRILVDIGRLAGETAIGPLLDQAVVQVARAVEIKTRKGSSICPRTADLLVVAGLDGRRASFAPHLVCRPASAPGERFRRRAVTIKNFNEQEDTSVRNS